MGIQTENPAMVEVGVQVEKSPNTLRAIEALPEIMEKVQTTLEMSTIPNQVMASAPGDDGSAPTRAQADLADATRPCAKQGRWRAQGA